MKVIAWGYVLCRWVLGLIFIYAGAVKLFTPQNFAVLIGAYGIIPEALTLPAAVLLPAIEVLAGIGIVFDIRGSLTVIAGMLVLFIGILSYGIWMGLDVDCGCFGADDPEATAFHGLRSSIYRDLVLLAITGIVFIWRRFRKIRPVKWFSIYKMLRERRRGYEFG